MINYDSIDNDKKQILKNQLIKNTTSLGGKNHFLPLIEDLKRSHPNLLIAKEASLRSDKSLIKWKIVNYKDKINLLLNTIIRNELKN